MRIIVLAPLALALTLGCRAKEDGLVDADGDGSPASMDCDDNNPDVRPGALELCNNRDDDCDALVDEDALDATVFYADADGDGFGNPALPMRSCVDLDGASLLPTDCDDADPDAFPGADEVCDGVDNDCDGTPDDDPVDGQTFYPDRDGDTYGDLAGAVTACAAPDRYVDNADDCQDSDDRVHPGATEDDCTDPTDYDCDGVVAWADADGDGAAACVDCDDTDPAVRPGQLEICDGLDNDCDGTPDDDPIDATTWYADVDDDGHGDPSAPIRACTAPEGATTTSDDCDDADPLTYPGAAETCDGMDNDCDGVYDDAPIDATLWYADLDGDGYAGARISQRGCVAPDPSWLDEATDCDDLDAAVSPSALEVCNGVDDDCDGDVDADAVDAPTWYADADGDGYGDPTVSSAACSAPAGTVAGADDCDDTDGAVGAASTWYADADGDGHGDPAVSTEACRAPAGAVASADDCDDTDGAVGAASTWYADGDGDGYGDLGSSTEACAAPTGHVADGTDCDDADPVVNPGAPEVCDGRDDDCDGSADVGATDASTWYTDADGDLFGDPATAIDACAAPAGAVAVGTDCDDADPTVHPGGVEVCDGADDDCDGTPDDGAVDAVPWYADADTDGYGDASAVTVACAAPAGAVADGTDCDDTQGTVHPGAAELCNTEDDDCDGTADEDPTDATLWYADLDGDGVPGDAYTALACAAPDPTWGATASDCDDLDASAFPGGTEVCDGADDDCDGTPDDGAVDAPAWYLDADGDGWGLTADAVDSCTTVSGRTTEPGDCDDGDGDVHPYANEWCHDSVDSDCNGDPDRDAVDAVTQWTDADGDGYGDPGTLVHGCTLLPAHVENADDCDDAAAGVFPGATETCDTVDEDCDGAVDEGAEGDGADCAVASCLDLLGARPAAPTGTYWLDPEGDGSATTYDCDMDTGTGGWTRVEGWDGATQDLAAFEAAGLVYNGMGVYAYTSGYVYWSGDGYEALAWEIPVVVPNGGEARTDLDYEGVSMEGSGIFFAAHTSAGWSDIACDDTSDDYGGYDPADEAWRPYTCPTSDTSITYDAVYEQDHGSPIDGIHIRSLHADNGSGDRSYLYRIEAWVR